MKKRLIVTLTIFLLFGFIFLYFFNGITGAVIYHDGDCQVKVACLPEPTERNIIDVYDVTNSHVSAENPNYKQLCCPSTTGIISNNVVGRDSCGGTPALWMSADDNAHIAEVGNLQSQNYQRELCLTGTDTIACVYETVVNPNACNNPEQFCLLKYREQSGFTGTNAHVADCTDDLYDKRICCSGEGSGGECLEEADVCSTDSECCDISQGYTKDQYCSTGEYEILSEGHCCEEGWYWYQPNIGPGYCASADPCYEPEDPMADPDLCNYALLEPQNYFNDPDCTRYNPTGYYEACCNKNWYGTTGEYFYCPIEAI